ncbi:CidA/LrgA family protein [Silvibacterium acidisoli]|uniref:CidA/LrgA family protein n=1 Tax=Acidobacteriaceae bacterium ZG23-2 TaxID=2883246 RepID=UPI00406BEB2E
MLGFSAPGERCGHLLSLPVPGAIVGMLFLLLALLCGLLKIDSLRREDRLPLAEMLLSFIPVGLVVVDHREFIGLSGLKIR